MSKKLLLAFALTMPVVAFFAGYFFNHNPALIPTGFIQYDNVSYIAYARQYLDAGAFQLQYSNPFNDGPGYENIYFQVQTLFFALLLKMGISPVWILPLFTIVCSFTCFYLLISIYDHLTTDRNNRTLILWLFAWGGGLLVLAGIVYHFLFHPGRDLATDLFAIDPEGGWWGLNLGRSLLFSCEAYYHALFLGCILGILKQRWLPVLLLLFLLCSSHPFTGIELAGIVCTWVGVEWIAGKRSFPIWFAAGALLITVGHILFYLVYLEAFPDHRSVSSQYSLSWGLRYYRMLPAYAITGALAIATFYRSQGNTFFSRPYNRLFLCWFVVAFLLANHEVFMKARQPIHFTRGYIWTSLFLIGLPALQALLLYCKEKKKWLLLAGCVVLFLMDNTVWIFTKITTRENYPGTAYITREQKELYELLAQHSSPQTLIASTDPVIDYMATVYTSAYPLYAHPFTTPFAEKKKKLQEQLFMDGIADSSLLKKQLLMVVEKADSTVQQTIKMPGVSQVAETNRYLILKINP